MRSPCAFCVDPGRLNSLFRVAVAFVLPLALLAASPAWSDDVDHSARAKQLREESKARAGANLGYPTIADPNVGFERNIDYHELRQTIRRLGAIIEDMAVQQRAEESSQAAQGILAPVPAMGLAAYGPEGPNEKSVRLILEYRLMVQGNPRLKVGAVKAGDKSVNATVVTVDGSLVEEYEIDKATGAWRPVRR
ncbi:MAG: hypothetical protein OQK23_01095 [Rhodospirillales bacterium]|nr:hypothetical protein [Rhodospirillales bacterium]MCW8952552.1 hypothetical protein [Rhodospirillales bacterium]MCW8969827.1 hypothetical protein [Rhodospirillales bacterium]